MRNLKLTSRGHKIKSRQVEFEPRISLRLNSLLLTCALYCYQLSGAKAPNWVATAQPQEWTTQSRGIWNSRGEINWQKKYQTMNEWMNASLGLGYKIGIQSHRWPPGKKPGRQRRVSLTSRDKHPRQPLNQKVAYSAAGERRLCGKTIKN